MTSLGASCSENYAFITTWSRGVLAIDVIFFVVYLIFFVLFIISRLKSPASRDILTGFFFGLAIICSSIYFIIRLIMLCLSECGNVDFVQYSQGEVAVVIFEHISEFLLLVTILVFMTSHVQFLAGKNPKPIRIIYAVIAAVFAVIMLAYIALDCYNFTNYYSGVPDGLYRADSRLGTAYYAIYLIISIVAVITLIICLVQMNSCHIASGTLKIWIPIFSISQIVWTALVIFEFSYWLLESHDESDGVSVALEFLIDFFQAIAYLSVIFIGTSSTVAAGGVQQTYGPVEPAYGGLSEQAMYTYQPPQQAVHQQYQPYQQQTSTIQDEPIYVPSVGR